MSADCLLARPGRTAPSLETVPAPEEQSEGGEGRLAPPPPRHQGLALGISNTFVPEISCDQLTKLVERGDLSLLFDQTQWFSWK